MKYVVIVSILMTSSYSLTKKCEKAIVKATEIHMQYVNGKIKISKSYNATKKMKKVCKR